MRTYRHTFRTFLTLSKARFFQSHRCELVLASCPASSLFRDATMALVAPAAFTTGVLRTYRSMELMLAHRPKAMIAVSGISDAYAQIAPVTLNECVPCRATPSLSKGSPAFRATTGFGDGANCQAVTIVFREQRGGPRVPLTSPNLLHTCLHRMWEGHQGCSALPSHTQSLATIAPAFCWSVFDSSIRRAVW